MKIKNTLILFIFFFAFLSAQRQANSRKQDILNQYQFSIFTIADQSSDSIKVLSYLSVPNNVLKFVKEDVNFISSYEATVSLKEKKGSLVGRKNWSNTLKTDSYLESTSREIFTIHFHEFKIVPGDYIISAEVLDRDSNNGGIVSKNLKLKNYSGPLALYKPFFLDFIEGNWGLDKNEIPLFRSYPGEKINQASIFISGKVLPGPFTLELIINNSKRKKIWNKSFQLVSEKESFHQRIIIPDEVSKEGLRKKVDIILTQNGKSKKESAILSILRPGISNSIGNISQAIQNMRYILRDDEWKKLKKAKSDERESLFLEYWSGKDPTPETEENEIMDEYFSRINYSNANFKSYTDGWKTDMGMIYILFGPPDDLETYNDPLSRLYSQRWHYYGINKYFDFVDENGFGDYRLTTPFFRTRSW